MRSGIEATEELRPGSTTSLVPRKCCACCGRRYFFYIYFFIATKLCHSRGQQTYSSLCNANLQPIPSQYTQHKTITRTILLLNSEIEEIVHTSKQSEFQSSIVLGIKEFLNIDLFVLA